MNHEIDRRTILKGMGIIPVALLLEACKPNQIEETAEIQRAKSEIARYYPELLQLDVISVHDINIEDRSVLILNYDPSVEIVQSEFFKYLKILLEYYHEANTYIYQEKVYLTPVLRTAKPVYMALLPESAPQPKWTESFQGSVDMVDHYQVIIKNATDMDGVTTNQLIADKLCSVMSGMAASTNTSAEDAMSWTKKGQSLWCSSLGYAVESSVNGVSWNQYSNAISNFNEQLTAPEAFPAIAINQSFYDALPKTGFVK